MGGCQNINTYGGARNTAGPDVLLADHLPDHLTQVSNGDRLFQENDLGDSEAAQAMGRIAADEDEVCGWAAFERAPSELVAAHAGHDQISDEDIRAAFFQELQCFIAVG